MTNTLSVRWLRFSYWLGALVDGFMVIPMLSPKMNGWLFGIDHFNPSADYCTAMGMGAALMAGWTVLLLWADRKPFERKGVLLITVFPAILGLAAAGFYAYISGFITLAHILPTWILQLTLSILLLYSYFSTGVSKPISQVKQTTQAKTPAAF